MMKRILYILLTAILLLPALCACGGMPPEQQKEAYTPIIEQYTALLTAKQNGETLTPPDTTGMSEGEAAVAEAVYTAVNINNFPEDMAYTYWDMDGNGTLELLLMTSPPTLKAVFTLDGKTPVLLGYADEDVTWYYGTKGELIRIHEALEEEQGNITLTYARVAGTTLTEDTSFGVTYEIKDGKRPITGYYEMVDGEKQTIDKERYDSLSEVYNALWDDANLYEGKLNTPCMFFPLAEGDATPPPADFSSYEAVKSTFKAMVAYVPRANAQWPTGKLDACFTYDSDEEFRIYNHLMLMARQYAPNNGVLFSNTYPKGGENAYGYCEADINGDGIDELLLMTDDYSVFSIFTTVKGKVVYVEDYTDFLLDWGFKGMDAEGRFYGWRATTMGLGREWSVFEMGKDGRLTQTLGLREVFFSENDGYFKTEGGEYVSINKEEYEAIKADQYDKFDFATVGTDGEVIRNTMDLTFTPLFALPTPDQMDLSSAWENYRYDPARPLYLGDLREDSIQFHWIGLDYEGNRTDTFISATATLTDGKYVFDADGVKGYLEFGVCKIWLVVESSEKDNIPPRAYLMDTKVED